MGYGINPELVVQRRDEVRALEQGKTARWTTTRDPLSTRRLAFRIRETLRIAAKFPERFPALARAAEMFSIHEVEDGLVEARFKVGSRTGSSVSPTETSIHGLDTFGKSVPSVGLTTANQVIEAWKAHLPSNDALHFTRTKLSPDELLYLHHWTTTWQPRLMILVGDDTLTLSLWDVTVSEFAWNPAPPPKDVIDDEDLDL